MELTDSTIKIFHYTPKSRNNNERFCQTKEILGHETTIVALSLTKKRIYSVDAKGMILCHDRDSGELKDKFHFINEAQITSMKIVNDFGVVSSRSGGLAVFKILEFDKHDWVQDTSSSSLNIYAMDFNGKEIATITEKSLNWFSCPSLTQHRQRELSGLSSCVALSKLMCCYADDRFVYILEPTGNALGQYEIPFTTRLHLFQGRLYGIDFYGQIFVIDLTRNKKNWKTYANSWPFYEQ